MVTTDSDQSAIVIWEQDNNIWSARRLLSTGTWTAPEMISSTTDLATKAQIAANSDGKAVVAWEQQAADNSRTICANIFDPGTGWATPQQIDSNSGYPRDPAVGIDTYGKAIVSWAQQEGTDPASSWQTDIRQLKAGVLKNPSVWPVTTAYPIWP